MSLSMFYGFAMAFGFALAGLAGALYRLLTNRRLSFELADATGRELALGVVMLMFGGPAVLMRNAIRGRIIENRAVHWLVLSTLIAAMWSFFSGVTMISGLNVLDG